MESESSLDDREKMEDDMEIQETKLMQSFRLVKSGGFVKKLQWRVSYKVVTKRKKAKVLYSFHNAIRGCLGGENDANETEYKTILDNVIGEVQMNQLLAIMGPSGSGPKHFLPQPAKHRFVL